MNRPLLGFTLFFIFIIALCSCNRATNAVNPVSCDSVILKNFISGANSLKSEPAKLLDYTINYYHGTPSPCRNIISELVSNKAFAAIYRQQDIDKQGIQFLDSMGHEHALTNSHRALALLKISAYYLYGLSEPDKALSSLMEVKAMEKDLNREASKVFNATMSQYYYLKTDYKEACIYFLKSIKMAEEDKDSVSIAANSINFSSVYNKMGNYDEGLRLAKRALAMFSEIKGKMGICYSYQEIGLLYSNLKMYDSSDIAYKNAIKSIEATAPDPSLRFDVYISLANNAIERDSAQQAILYFLKAKNLLATLKDDKHQKLFVIASTPIFATIKPVNDEIAQIKNIIDESYKDNDLDLVQKAYLSLNKIYSKYNNTKVALYYFIKSDSISRLISSNSNIEYIAEMNTKLQSEQKQLIIQVQKKDIKKLNYQIALFSSLILILIIIVAFILASIRLKRDKKNNDAQTIFTHRLMAGTDKERNKTAIYLQERIGQKLLSLKEYMNGDENTTKVDAILSEIDDISQDLHPMLLVNSGLNVSVHDICNQMSKNNKVKIECKTNYNATLMPAQELQIFRMIQEALNNIVKYADATLAAVTLYENNDAVITEVNDNGKGFNVELAFKSGKAFGIVNIKERTRMLKGIALIVSNAGGTKISITIPKHRIL